MTALVAHNLIAWEIRKSNVGTKCKQKEQSRQPLLLSAYYIFVGFHIWFVCIVFQVFFPKFKKSDIFLFVSIVMVILNSSMNFFIYLICNKHFRQSLKMILRLKRTEVNPEA